ncbi:ATP-binding protein [Pseudoalteromonas luteoviolacea]|uniref:ATP-binding protein n=1 Tax=Pseudoalteromonas luteoviolacea TaxID=43657 RepID=UPI001F1770FE|nr:ATP-binding protein [Pseudoalteromonas luteoviolacea]MCF6439166.1 ATP-binding protein [Pseudoalteromonas luteoviolacea]
MLRLLASLYFFVFFSIIAINQSSEYIWKHWANQTPSELGYAKQVADNLRDVLNNVSIENYPQKNGLDIIHINDVAWFPEQRTALEKGDVVISFDSSDNYQLFMRLADEVSIVKLGPFEPKRPSIWIKYGFKLISFSILALLLILWLRPLWQDLEQLKRITEQLATGQLDIVAKPSRFSAISTLTQHIQKLALQTASLMQNQKHLVNAVSHELRTPLARLKFALAMLAPKDPRQVQAMNQDVTEMELLIDEMLSYARLEFSEREMSKTTILLSDLIEAQIDKCLVSSNKQIEQRIASGIYVKGNDHYLARVIQNLLQNAEKYGAQKIQIELKFKEQHAILSISDDGPGIPEEKRENVFSPFIRLDSSRSKETGGFGLGLAIVAKILSWHNGKCWITESEMQGATFNVSLPAHLNAKT